MNDYLAIRCRGTKKKKDRLTGEMLPVHRAIGGSGHLLFVFFKNSIYARCSDRSCKCWNKIDIKIPGVNVDFSKVSIVQKTISGDIQFPMKNGAIKHASVVIEGGHYG